MKRWLAMLLGIPALAWAGDSAFETRTMFYVEKRFDSGGARVPPHLGLKFMHGPQDEMQKSGLAPRRSAVLDWRYGDGGIEPLRLNGVVLRQSGAGGGGAAAAGLLVAVGVLAVAAAAAQESREEDNQRQRQQLADIIGCVVAPWACGTPGSGASGQ